MTVYGAAVYQTTASFKHEEVKYLHKKHTCNELHGYDICIILIHNDDG